MKRILSLLLTFALTAGFVCFAPPAEAVETKLIAITFDDGPSRYTDGLLDGLKARGAKATFFMVGYNIDKYPATIARAYQEGHQIANHSNSHTQLTTLSAAGVKNEIQTVNTRLNKTCGTGTSYMVRVPYGSVNATVSEAVGAPLIQWSVDPCDWKYRNAETVKKKIISQAKDGAIILVHDIHATTIPGALAAIDALQAQGYEFVTVQELFRRRGVTPKNGVVYNHVAPNGMDLGPVAVPEITVQPAGDQLRVTITAQKGAGIYYTTTGGALNQESTRYTEPFLVSAPCTVKAVAAFQMNGSRSESVEAVFRMPMATAPEISVHDGLLTLYTATPGGEICYALQDGDFRQYIGPVLIAPDTEIRAYTRRAGYETSATVRASYSARGNLFWDVFPSQWYYEDMDRAAAAGYMNGVGHGLYAPKGALQRGQLIALLYRCSGETVNMETAAALPFIDVPEDAYYAEAVAWAYEKGVVDGTGGQIFAPSRVATRQEMCKIIWSYLRTLGIALPEGTGAVNQYADGEKIAPWAYDAMEQLTAIGLLSGDSGGKCNPTAESSRAQAAVVLMRMMDFVAGQAEQPVGPDAGGPAEEIDVSGGAGENAVTAARMYGRVVGNFNSTSWSRKI